MVWFFVQVLPIIPRPYSLVTAGVVYLIAAYSVVIGLVFYYFQWFVSLPRPWDGVNTFLGSLGAAYLLCTILLQVVTGHIPFG